MKKLVNLFWLALFGFPVTPTKLNLADGWFGLFRSYAENALDTNVNLLRKISKEGHSYTEVPQYKEYFYAQLMTVGNLDPLDVKKC